MTAASVTAAPRSAALRDRLPVVHQLRQSVGLQRGMLVAGLVMLGDLHPLRDLRAAARAVRLRAAQRTTRARSARQQPPSPEHLFGTTVGGYDVLSRVIWGTQTAILVIIVAVLLSIFIGVRARPLLGLLRRLARPRARRRLRRDLRLPVAAARDRRCRS